MIVPILQTEKQIQVRDMIRFDASRSFLVKGSVGAITSVQVQPGADQTPIEVFHANPKNWFLDFAFTQFAFDIDSTNGTISFEASGQPYSTNVLPGSYDLANLLVAMKNAIEATAPSLTVSVTVDDRNRVSFESTTPLKFQPNTVSTDLLKHLGFKKPGLVADYPLEYGLRKISLIVSTPTETATAVEYVECYTPEGDALFSNDSDLLAEEPDILKWVAQGRSSFLDLHRRSQRLIVDWLDRQGYRDTDGNKLTKFSVLDNSDVHFWSLYQALKLFFMGVQNQNDDVFKNKAAYYEKREIESRDRALLSLDLDNDGKKDAIQGPDIRSGRLFLR